MGPKWSPNRPRDVPRDVPNTRLQKRPLGPEKLGHFGVHGRSLSKLGAALGAILEKMYFEGVQKSSFLRLDQHKWLQEGAQEGGLKTARNLRGKNMPQLLLFGMLKTQR